MGLVSFTDIGVMFFSQSLIPKDMDLKTGNGFSITIFNHLNFNVTTAVTTDKIVITQNLTAILLS